jgi:hypothetical protein
MIHGGVSENPQSAARSCVDVERLREVLPAARAAYASADPFPHVVIDGFLRPEVARRLETEFPKPDHRIWKHHLHLNSHKFACNRLDAMPPLFQAVLRELNGRGVVEFLEALTGIGDLLPDVELEGGGLHQIVPGGFLKVHADFNYHPATRHHRRLNLLVYLNSGWPDSGRLDSDRPSPWNGNLELWDRSVSRCVKSIAPVLNRCVVFSTTDAAYHGHPRPLSCPSGMSRKSLALYYYTVARPRGETSEPHSTLYQRVPTDSLLASSLRLARQLPGALPQVLRTSLKKRRG